METARPSRNRPLIRASGHAAEALYIPRDNKWKGETMRREADVDVRTHGIRAAKRNGGTGRLQDFEGERGEPGSTDTPLPYLEDIMGVASKYPYSALAAMIAIAGVIVAAVVTLGVAMFTGMFLMYGQQARSETKLDTVLQRQTQMEGQISVIKTIYMSNLARQDVMITLMPKSEQEQMNAYDRANPRIPMPEGNQEKKQQ